ncbi:MAG TPA: fumarylacetoacetate hydrolase family protein [Steroidobacteraceae bacterium]|nr:fumarylacetoacetate hydrolase family protein [Steroidobacteraceae bacterium]
MTEYVFVPPPIPSVEIAGTRQRFPVHRIYCVGRNYAEHAREMGNDPKADPPVFFTKPADAIVANGVAVPYPPRTDNFHYEVELVVAVGGAGRNIAAAQAFGHVFGYAVGNDLTRRDLQGASKKKGLPWDTGKAFDASAPIGAIRPASLGHIVRGRIWLNVNGETRQQSDICEMIWSVSDIIAELSTLFELRAGDLIYTGTPAGVGPLKPGDRIECGIDGLESLSNTIVAFCAK